MLRAKMIRDDAADAFWAFSLAVYDAPGVAGLCLDLQEKHGVDVNLLLFGAWMGASGRGRLAADEVARLAEAIAPLNRDVVRPLRAARVALKAMVAQTPALRPLREQVKATELEAERMVQLRLAALGAQGRPLCDAPARLGDVGANLTTCLDHVAIADADVRAHALRVLAAAIAGLGPGAPPAG